MDAPGFLVDAILEQEINRCRQGSKFACLNGYFRHSGEGSGKGKQK